MADDNVVPLPTAQPQPATDAPGERVSSSDLDWTEFHRVNDVEALANLREWARDAFTAKGARVTGSGMGFGAIDLDVEIEGFGYNVSIRPLKEASKDDGGAGCS